VSARDPHRQNTWIVSHALRGIIAANHRRAPGCLFDRTEKPSPHQGGIAPVGRTKAYRLRHRATLENRDLGPVDHDTLFGSPKELRRWRRAGGQHHAQDQGAPHRTMSSDGH
jgi:hypothetical protein